MDEQRDELARNLVAAWRAYLLGNSAAWERKRMNEATEKLDPFFVKLADLLIESHAQNLRERL